MTKGQVDYAERKALDLFDRWNDITGFVGPCTGYYYEIQHLLRDAVHIGAQMAINGEVVIHEGEVVKPPTYYDLNEYARD